MTTLLPQQTTVNQYIADGIMTVFTYSYLIFLPTDINVYVTLSGNQPNPTADLKTLNVDYTVQNAGNINGGTVTFTVAPPVSAIVTLVQGIQATYNMDFSQAMTISGANLNLAFERLTAICANLQSNFSRIAIQYAIDQNLQPPNPPSNIVPSLPNGYVWTGLNGTIIAVPISSGTGGGITALTADNGVTATPSTITTTGIFSLTPMAAFTVKGNDTAAPAIPTDLTQTQLLSLLGISLTGLMFNFQQGQFTTPLTITSTTFVDTGISITITPTSNSNKVLVRAVFVLGRANAGDQFFFRFTRAGTPIGVGTSVGSRTPATSAFYSGNATNASSENFPITMEWLDSPATTSATVYKVQALGTGGNSFVLGTTGADTNGVGTPRTVSVISVLEIHA